MAIVGAVAAVLVVILHFAGIGFSMRLLPADAMGVDLVARVDGLVDEGVIDDRDGYALATQLAIERDARAELDAGRLPESEAIALRERLPPEDQSTVIGVGGVFGLIPMIFAFLVAATIGTAVARGRRPREVLLGLGAASILQLVLWTASVEFDVAALVGGRLLMTGPGPAFTGGPILLLAVSLVAAIAASTGLGYAVGLGLDQARGMADCPHCGHVFPRAKGQLQCPACTRPLEVAHSVTAGPGGMTRAQTGATELLCIQCVKTYAADACPIHADEPLLDPRQDAVRFQLLDLDTQAGTARFARWTAGLGQRPEDAPNRTGGVCMECAKAYATPTCPLHPDEPLLDPSVEAVRLEMEEADDRRRNRVGTRLMFGGFGLAAAITVTLASLIELDGSLMISVFAGSLVGLIAVARVLTPALSPPRYGAWTGAQAVSNTALADEAKRELLGPVMRSLQRAKQHLIGLVLTTVGAAALGGLLAFVMTWPIALGLLAGGLLGLLAFGVYLEVTDAGRKLHSAARSVAEEWRDPYSS